MIKKFDGKTKFQTLSYISKHWLSALRPTEFMVVHFIWARTIAWGWREEFIYNRHFIAGIPEVIGGLPIEVRQLQTVLANLERNGFIIRRRVSNGYYYSLAIPGLPYQPDRPRRSYEVNNDNEDEDDSCDDASNGTLSLKRRA